MADALLLCFCHNSISASGVAFHCVFKAAEGSKNHKKDNGDVLRMTVAVRLKIPEELLRFFTSSEINRENTRCVLSKFLKTNRLAFPRTNLQAIILTFVETRALEMFAFKTRSQSELALTVFLSCF